MNTRLFGAMGEQMAARYLRLNKYEICTANFTSSSGEIDIVAKKDKTICFVEVKTRKQGGLTSPADAVDFRKQENIRDTAADYMRRFEKKFDTRFDIIEVIVDDNNSLVSINHIKNAF